MQVAEAVTPFVSRVIARQQPPAWKRACDIVMSVILLTLLSPVFALVALWIKLVSPGPVFFRQDRVGHGGFDFRIAKFRTMHIDSEATAKHREYLKSLEKSQPFAKPKFDSRLIPGGSFLRKFSVDELPQLWNVLIGEMSLVGPRPDVFSLKDYETPFELRRFEVQPGITGLWQVSGKNSLTYEQMIELDVRYVDDLSWSLDALIVAKTFRVLLSQDNN